MIESVDATTLHDATAFLDSVKKGLVDAGIIDANGNSLKVPTPASWNERITPTGWVLTLGSQKQPIDVDQGTHLFPINIDSGSQDVPIVVEDDGLALAIPAPVTPALPLFLAESDRPAVDV